MNRAILIVAGLISASSLLLVDSAIKGMALLLLAAVVALVLRRDSAATRHMVWQLAMVALLVVPLLSAILPQWRVLPAWTRLPAPAAVVEAPPTTDSAPANNYMEVVKNSKPTASEAPSKSEDQADFEPVEARPMLEPPTVVAASPETNWDWRSALALLWSFGFVLLMLRLTAARWMLWNLERNGMSKGFSGRAVEADGDPLYAALEDARLQLGIVRPVKLLIHSDKTIPVVWGIIRCRLLLPSTARLWNGEQLRSVLLHELAHIKRRDALGQLLTQIACAVHWFNPLVWFAAWRLAVERERACDDLVLASGVRASAYAGHLLEVVTESGPSRWIDTGALAMARKSSLEGRMVAVLSEQRNRRRVSLALLGFALAIAVGIAVPLAMLRAADQSSKEEASIKVVEEPRTATASGSYELGDKVRLVVNQAAGDSFATIHFPEPEADAARPAPSHRIALPEGGGEFAFAWIADSGELWLMRKSEKFLWRYRFNALGLKEEGRFDLWPLTVLSTPLRRALQDTLGLREPQDLPPLGDEGLETPESGPGSTKTAKLRLGTEERIAWGQPENGLRAALVRLSPETELKAGAVVDLNVVVQNVSDTPIWLRGGSPAANAVLKTVDGGGKESPVENSILDILSTIDEFKIAPREVAVMSLMSVGIGEYDVNSRSIEGRAIGYWTGKSRAAISNETLKGSISIADSPEGFWEGTLNFGALKIGGKSEVDSNAATTINQTQSKARLPKISDESYTKVGVHYQKFREEDSKRPRGKLMGDVLNPTKNVDGPLVLGLRMASDAKWNIGGEARVELVVRNQSNDDVKFAQTPRADNGLSVVAIDKDGKEHQAEIAQFDGLLILNHLLLPKNGYVVLVKSFTVRFDTEKRHASEPNVASFHLPPGDYTLRCNWRDAHPEVSHEGEWTGELTSVDYEFQLAAAASPVEQPQDRDGKALLDIWQKNARQNGNIPGGLIARLRDKVQEFVKINTGDASGDPYAKRMAPILPKLDASHDWKPADVAALFDEIASVTSVPLNGMLRELSERTIRAGKALPKELADSPYWWGKTDASGLRVAWVLEPRPVLAELGTKASTVIADCPLGTALKSRLLIHNAGKSPVIVRVPTFNQGNVKARDATAAEVPVTGIEFMTRTVYFPYRLASGEYVEIRSPGVGIGEKAGSSPWESVHVGWNVLAHKGDWVALTHAPVALKGFGAEPAPKAGADWWTDFIQKRIERELPAPGAIGENVRIPPEAADRKKLLGRVMFDLFVDEPTAEEHTAFDAIKSPESLAAFVGRLAKRGGVTAFSGELEPAEAWFRILAADPNAASKPRVTMGPGEYPLSGGTLKSGSATLKIVGRPMGERRTHDAHILFEATEATGILPPKPYKLNVPDGWGTWAIVCRPGETVLYLLTPGAARKIDFSNPVGITETPHDDWPEGFREQVKRILELHEVPAADQEALLARPAAPATEPAPKAEIPKEGASTKLTPSMLHGFWRGQLNDEEIAISFHRSPVDPKIRTDLYVDRATIGEIMSFKIAADGMSVILMTEQGPSKGATEFGRLTPGDQGTLELEVTDKMRPGKVLLTRDVEEPATEPRQKEPRELFAMWKRTANGDGTIPGTFIGMLAEEVRAYVRANPNLNSGMELPKLLPRFVTTRDWTAEEAIALLDDVAYYSTAPIEARLAKNKLPSGPLWRTMVCLEDIPVKIESWSDAKEGLRIGIRVVEADWRLGGKTKLQLWLHNSGEKDLSFMTTGPDRQDVGVAVCAKSADGREHWAENGNVMIIAIPLHCTLPAGHVAKVRDLTVSIDAPDNKELSWFAPKFRELAPGKYKLRCLWTDAQPSLSSTGQWTGELTTNDLEFELGREVK